MKLVGRRMCQIESRLEDLVFLSVEQRLSKLIHYLAEEYGQNTAQGTLIGIKLTHEEMGQMINATRPTVSELLQKMQSQNKIRIVKRQILVLPQQIHAA
jgi:CRP/FNR family transcriptional regulator